MPFSIPMGFDVATARASACGRAGKRVECQKSPNKSCWGGHGVRTPAGRSNRIAQRFQTPSYKRALQLPKRRPLFETERITHCRTVPSKEAVFAVSHLIVGHLLVVVPAHSKPANARGPLWPRWVARPITTAGWAPVQLPQLLYQPQDLDLALRPGERDREHLVERGRRGRANPLAGGPGGLAQSEPGSAFPRPDLRHPQSRGVLSDPAMSDIAYPAALLLPSAHPPPPSHVRPYPCRGRALLFLQPRVLLSAWVQLQLLPPCPLVCCSAVVAGAVLRPPAALPHCPPALPCTDNNTLAGAAAPRSAAPRRCPHHGRSPLPYSLGTRARIIPVEQEPHRHVHRSKH